MTTPTQQWSDWIEWTGGECPIPGVPGRSYVLRFRSGEEHSPLKAAADKVWWHDGYWSDIVAYRYRIRPTDAPAEPSPSLVEAAEAMAAALSQIRFVIQIFKGRDVLGYEVWEDSEGFPRSRPMVDELLDQAETALAIYRTTSKEG